jgi:multicomponent Na+:H+ antiporter subunit B
MSSLILSTATRYILPLLLLFSVFSLLRGHNEPGGGFIGAMIASVAYALYAIAYGVAEARRALRIDPILLIGAGLLIATLAATLPLLVGEPLMKAFWTEWTVPVLGKLGTPLFFEIGLYFTVLGVMLLIIFSLAED